MASASGNMGEATTTTTTAAAAAAAAAGASDPTTTPTVPMTHDDIWNLVLLQTESIQARLREFHQQVEAFVQLTGEDPLAAVACAAQHADPMAIPLRERGAGALALLPMTDDWVVRMSQELCDPHGAIGDPTAMGAFMAQLATRAPTLTPDAKAQVLFILDATFTRHRAVAVVDPVTRTVNSVFDSERGFELVVEWAAAAGPSADEQQRALTHLILQFLRRHRPTMQFARKTLVTHLRALRPKITGRANKAQFKELLETCQSWS